LKGRILVWPVAALLLAALVLQSVRLYDRLLASRLVHQVELISLAAAASNPAILPRLLPINLAQLRRAGAADPLAVEVPLSRGSLYLLLHRPEEAAAAYREALALEPHPEIYLHLGDALLNGGHLDEARAIYRSAIVLSPWARAAIPGGVL
jgi:tetratricopeptide (TPR) repeat protein